mmetsp:Transcript_35144/g.41446  ORF Transcript_35144/g.41446 Transcript_35144/m.41446 type:complete len:87 (-) Transcript_35144:145-405(-)
MKVLIFIIKIILKLINQILIHLKIVKLLLVKCLKPCFKDEPVGWGVYGWGYKGWKNPSTRLMKKHKSSKIVDLMTSTTTTKQKEVV